MCEILPAMSTPLFNRALSNEKVERPPVWLMRQAGRYMPEYRALKEKYSFLGLVKNSDLAVEVTMQPIEAFDLDAAIVFSDILVPAELLGFGIDFNPGPVVQGKIERASDIDKLSLGSISSELGFMENTLKQLKQEMRSRDKSLIGFSATPWTLACYLVEQSPYKNFIGTSVFEQQEPAAFSLLLDKLTDCIIEYLNFQVEAGVDCVQLFDSWVGVLSPEKFKELSLERISRIVKEVKAPVICYFNGASPYLEQLKEINAPAFSLDHKTNLLTTRDIIGTETVLQGNLDPALLFSSKENVYKNTRNLIESWPEEKGLIINLGHGILQKTPVENVSTLVEAVKEGW